MGGPRSGREAVVVAGVDAGTTCVKALLLGADSAILGRAAVPTRGYFQACAEEALTAALLDAQVEAGDLAAVGATGYGARCVPLRTTTAGELACLARGAFFHFPRAMTVVDLGGQDPKIVRLDGAGRRVAQWSARKCAVGAGAFLEFAARQLDVHPTRLEELAAAAEAPAEIGSYCSVFAVKQILERLRAGASREAVARGCIESIAERVLEMGELEGPVVATGGVTAYFPGILRALAERSGQPVEAAPEPINVGALGAALAARAAGVGEG